MNKRIGFTLVELLLVVAILAIVAAAASPTFFEGAQEAIAEARKAPFLSAYQNTVSGANTALSTALTRGEIIEEDGKIPRFADYVPVSARTFKDEAGKDYTVSAFYHQANKKVVIFVGNYNGDNEPSYSSTGAIDNTTPDGLNHFWRVTINGHPE